MGVASYLEDDLTRFLESTAPMPVPSLPEPPRHYCPFCGLSFDDRHALSEHLSSSHHGDRPVLVIGGREPERSSTIRQSLRFEQIAVENCSSARLRVNGASQIEVLPSAVPALVAQETDAVIDLELVNYFEEAANAIRQPYRLVLRIPDKESVDAVDLAFFDHLATGSPTMAQVAAFLQDRRCAGVVADYADALGSYVRGLLVKDQALGTGVTLPPAEGDQLYGAALDALKGFQRPLAIVVCGLIRFAFNDFAFVDRPTGFRRLDRCNALLASLGLDISATKYRVNEEQKSVVKLCPTDQAIDRVLDLSERLARQTRWGPTVLEDCRQAAEAQTLGARDRVKVYVLWAATAVRLGADDSALGPLRHLRANYPFGPWAAGELDRIEE